MIASAAEFYRLRESNDPDEFWRASHEEAPVEIWREVIRERPDMRFWVAQNKTVPIVILEVLASDSDVRVRDMVARKRKISEAIAVRLAHDADESVRAALTYNKKLPERALAILRVDESPFVQEKVHLRDKKGQQGARANAHRCHAAC
jgi:hypothetical protein